MKLEFKYGPLPGFTPAIDDILDYLKPVSQKEEIRNLTNTCTVVWEISVFINFRMLKLRMENIRMDVWAVPIVVNAKHYG